MPELRITEATKVWRIILRIDEDAIVILDAFSKTTSKTPKSVIDSCMRRLRDYDDAIDGRSMQTPKVKRLERAGWRVGTTEEFLDLSEEERAMVEIKLALADAVKLQREKHRLSQGGLATRMKSSQSRVAKIEGGDPTVSLDLLVRAVLAAGATRKDLGRLFRG